MRARPAGGGIGPPRDGDLGPALAAARDGDEEAFGHLYRAMQPPLLRYLRTLVGGDAEDVASETWLQIARDLRSYRGDGGGFRAWAAGIARHRALDLLRHRDRRPAVPVPVDQMNEVAGRYDTADEAVAAVGTDAALALIASLPRDQAEAIMLRVVVGLDAESAGRVLGKRAGAVRTAAHRGLRRLAQNLPVVTDVPFGRPTSVPRWVTPRRPPAPKDVR